ncbi:cytochrome P450 [Aspergillus homomorphus CBS 101889]|uniref:Cytochrome P450 n=1 Tax=Aspergillus homomorphus (strain CBS 101889) TaxID=1450537 RepID=A0A395HK14_ASPHC|nr:cytochrome P450 [Aspergillus homomorphus CBS 101889]RAL07859.1 cytochrome P450 [Aspergillus homomorphus CBS 101889]
MPQPPRSPTDSGSMQDKSASTRDGCTNIIWTLLLVGYVIPKIFLYIQRLFSPILRIPGPWVHKLTFLPLKVAIAKGESHYFTVNLHKQYGPIVALSPTMISVADAGEIKRINQIEDWPRSEAVYGNFRQDPQRPTLLAFTDKKAYSQRQRLVSSMFGLRYVRSMQPLMLNCISVLMEELETRRRSGTATVDMQHMIQSLAADIIGVTTFGQTFDLTVTKRRALIANCKEPPREDLLQKMVEAADQDNHPGSTFRSSDVQDEVVVLLIAGSEATANAELFTLINLLRNMQKLATLYEEIDRRYPKGDDRQTDCDYSMPGMTYLQACIDETMRLVPGQATGSPRESLKDETLLGYSVPKGTTVFPTTRVCIGKHFAAQEMHLSLMSLLRKFRFKYIPGQDESTVFRIAQQMRGSRYMMKVSLR